MKAFFKHSFALVLILIVFQSTSFSKENLIAWKFKTGSSIHATPVIEDTVLYVGSLDKNFYAINKKTGQKIWQYTTNNEINSKATFNDSMIFFESGFKLFALDKKSGKLKWSFVASQEKPAMSLGLTDYHHSSPIIYKDVVYYGDGWGNMNGVDIKSGQIVFQYTVTGDSAAIRSTPAIQNDSIFFGTWAGHVFGVSLKDKSLLWKYSLKNRRPYYGMVTSDMVIKDTLLYFGSQHDVFSPLSLKTGKPAWTFIDPNQTYLPSTPVFYKNSVIIGSTIQTWKVYSLTNGKVNWSCKSDGIFFVHPVIVDSIVIMNTSNFGGNGTLFMINANNGKQIGEYHFSNAAPASPVVSDNFLYVGNGDGNLFAFNLKELLYPSDDTTIVLDTTSQKLEVSKNENIQKLPFKLENIGNACDSFFIKYELKGNPTEKGIVVSSKNSGHLASLTKTTLYYITVSPANLEPGSYEINYEVTSKRHPDQIYKKKYAIEIKLETKLANERTVNVRVYPNPAREYVNFSFDCKLRKKVELKVYATNGKMVYSFNGNADGNNLIWNTLDLAGKACKAGNYVYKIAFDNKTSSGIINLMGR